MGRGSRSGGGRSSFGGGGGRSSRSAPGRSSFNGGHSSFGGSRHFRGHHHHHGPRIHRHIHIGGGYYSGGGVSPKTAIMIVMIFFAFVFGMIGFSNIGSVNYHKESVQIAIEDYNFYQDMIDYAYENKDEGYIVNGEVVNKYYDENVGKYYVVYKLPGVNIEYETFSVYTLSQVSKYRTGGDIELALNNPVISETTESIDTDLQNVKLENFSLYVSANDALAKSRTTTYTTLGIAAILVVGVIFIAIKGNKSREDTTPSVSTNTEEKETTIRCRYCGAEYDSSKRKCSSCGANLRK